MRRLHLSVPSKILMALLAWGWEKTSGIKKTTPPQKKKTIPSWLRSHHRFILNPSPCVLWELLARLIFADLLLLPGSLHDFLLPIPWPSSVSPLPPPGGLLDSGSLEVVFGPSWLEMASVLFSQSSFWSQGRLPFCTFTNSLNKHFCTF